MTGTDTKHKTVKLGPICKPANILFGDLLDEIIEHQEGGFVLSADPDGGDGGWTFAGVTAKTFNDCIRFGGPIATYVEFLDVWNNSEDERKEIVEEIYDIYTRHYIIPLKLDKVQASIQGPLLSCAINCGVSSAVRVLRDANDFIALYESREAISAFCIFWFKYYQEIVRLNPAKQQFIRGWRNRVNYWLTKAGLPPLLFNNW